MKRCQRTLTGLVTTAVGAVAGCQNIPSSPSAAQAPTPLVATSRPVGGEVRGYFPPGIFAEDPERHQFIIDWYSKHLRAMNEPMLYASLPQNREVYRFLLLPTWGRPTAVRIQSTPAGEYSLIATVLSGSGGYEPGMIQAQKAAALTEREWREFKGLLREVDFWQQPARVKETGLDGSRWIIEGVEGDRYHLIDRWTPSSGPAYRLGSFLLELAGLESAE